MLGTSGPRLIKPPVAAVLNPSMVYGGAAVGAQNFSASPFTWSPANVWTPATGDIALFLLFRATQNAAPDLSLTLPSGNSIVRQSYVYGGAAGKASVAMWTARNVAAAALTPSIVGVANWGRAILFGVDLVNWTGNYHEVGLESYTGATTTTRTVSGTLSHAASALIGFGGMIAAGTSLYTAAGWTEDAEATEGSTDGTASSAGIFHATGGALGAAQSFALVSTKTWTDWGELLAEFW
jgi:hypothetical protein